MRILGIETSCDDTGVAVYDNVQGLIFNELISQSKIHSIYGGVVPELAARQHQYNIVPLIKKVLLMIQRDYGYYSLDAVAYTSGPGLIGSLMIGATIASALAFALDIPIVLVNHMEAHLLSFMLEVEESYVLEFPFLGLLVSGGHTQLIIAKQMGKYEILGDTLDDAVGETIDKVAQLLGMKYPGGQALSNLARQGKSGRFLFPRPMINHPGFNFSFSGLKTSVFRVVLENNKDQQTRADIARAFEEAVVDILVIKCKKAIKLTKIQNLVVAGGVSANLRLRQELQNMMYSICKGKVLGVSPKLCTDNGAMIAYTGMLRFHQGDYLESQIVVRPKWSISDLVSF
ncbi:tRNA (adenosine(37)-N6)-threonylcarbamoyltransferase complex transferase subunit TsaD [Buchnera aphidicola (Hormaphis cornu)]|nr:tRNA (adenosine(37)-N6)-threonylcarbamoyltransferase complex transferase subunit TsaD [Buchnera aphidicola (Hormaphis cornu)]